MSKRHERFERMRQEAASFRRQDGFYSPADLVSWAADHPDTAWHEWFEWDDSVAGHEYRLLQARWGIKRVLKIDYVDGPHDVSLYSVPSLRGGDNASFGERVAIMSNEDFRLDILREQKAKLMTCRKEYETMLPELAPVWRAIRRCCKPD